MVEYWKKSPWWKKALIVIGIPLVLIFAIVYFLYTKRVFWSGADDRSYRNQVKDVEESRKKIKANRKEVQEYLDKKEREIKKVEELNAKSNEILDGIGSANNADGIDDMRERINDLSRGSKV